MRVEPTGRRVSFILLCIALPVALIAAGIRPLRIPGVYQTLGAVLFSVVVTTAWVLGLHAIKDGANGEQRLAWAGGFLITPFALVSLLWVGLSTPWEAAAPENQMRYLVLAVMSIAVTCGFAVLWHALTDAGERLYSAVGSAANLLAGAAYLIWFSFALGAWVVRNHTGQMSPAIVSLFDVFDVLLFFACALTYLTTAVVAVALERARWLGRRAMYVYVTANAVALLFLTMRGFSFPDPSANSTPWYIQPGFIVGIPAVPWIMPFLLGVVLLRRAGDYGPPLADAALSRMGSSG